MAENIFEDPMLKNRGLDVEKGGFRLGDCILKRKLGAGGMGAVYEGIHTRLDCPVAVKIMHPNIASANSESVQRFIREAKLAAQLNMPGMIRVLDVNNLDDMYYIVMEYVEGESLQDMVKSIGPMPEVKALELIGEASKALGMAHEKGIIHRDIKPDNIMVDKTGRVMIADLGLAKSLLAGDEQLSMDGATMGTPSYMSPEQAMDSTKVDYRSDIYSMGATLWAMLAAEAPFNAATALQILQKVLTTELDDIRTRRPDVSEKTANIIKEMMAKEPHMRPASIGDIGQEMLKHAAVLESQGVGVNVGEASAGGDMVNPSSLNYEKTLVTGSGAPTSGVKTDPTIQMAQPAMTMQQTGGRAAVSGKSSPVPMIAAVLGIVIIAAVAVGVVLSRRGSDETQTASTETQTSGKKAAPAVTVKTGVKTPNPVATGNNDAQTNSGGGTDGDNGKPSVPDTHTPAVNPADLPEKINIVLADSVVLPFVKVSPGSFNMGDDSFKSQARFEQPIHEVEFTKYYFIGETEVTYAQFLEYLNSDNRNAKKYREKLTSGKAEPGPLKQVDGKWTVASEDLTKPVHYINWTTASQYIRWLNKTYKNQFPVKGWMIRFPSEEEWEYAARGPESNKYPWGNFDAIDIPANVDTPGGLSGPVNVDDERFSEDVSWCGAKGMGGNVAEWTGSIATSYEKNKQVDPKTYTGASDFAIRGYAIRGGFYKAGLGFCRGAFRTAADPDIDMNAKLAYRGFRLYLGRVR